MRRKAEERKRRIIVLKRMRDGCETLTNRARISPQMQYEKERLFDEFQMILPSSMNNC
jgi:hypothetical protein